MTNLKICGRFEVPRFEGCGFTHMISIGDSDDSFGGLRLQGIPEEAHLILKFSDVHDSDHPDRPTPESVAPLFSWLEGCSEINGLLVHCMAGIGRSPAVALLSLCALNPAVPPEIHMQSVLSAVESSFIMPNVLVTRIGDDLLGRDGEIVSVVLAFRGAQGN